MIAQLGLSLMLCGVLSYAWAQYPRSPAVGLVSMFAAAAGLYFVWRPAHATWLAEAVGIGRGVDLIFYLWVIISLLVMLNLHLKLRSQMELMTQLARELAIANAQTATSRK